VQDEFCANGDMTIAFLGTIKAFLRQNPKEVCYVQPGFSAPRRLDATAGRANIAAQT
jgi:hypothetical protein